MFTSDRLGFVSGTFQVTHFNCNTLGDILFPSLRPFLVTSQSRAATLGTGTASSVAFLFTFTGKLGVVKTENF